jgi:hypothetical protein
VTTTIFPITSTCSDCNQQFPINFGSQAGCSPNRCQNDGVCTDLGNGSFICNCTSQYIGK